MILIPISLAKAGEAEPENRQALGKYFSPIALEELTRILRLLSRPPLAGQVRNDKETLVRARKEAISL